LNKSARKTTTTTTTTTTRHALQLRNSVQYNMLGVFIIVCGFAACRGLLWRVDCFATIRIHLSQLFALGQQFPRTNCHLASRIWGSHSQL
jgi:hypothetical protein